MKNDKGENILKRQVGFPCFMSVSWIEEEEIFLKEIERIRMRKKR